MREQTPFKWRHFQPEIILLCVRWYLRYALRYRDLEEMMRERGLSVDHTTISRWVQQYAPELEKGIYDPGHYNHRLLLGFKGTMSEAELHWLRQRLLGGKVTKAEQGTLRFRLPVGLHYDLTGKVVLDPDEEVQAAVRLIFTLFEQFGSALAVVKHFTQHHLRFPDRRWERTRKGELVWEPLQCGRALSI